MICKKKKGTNSVGARACINHRHKMYKDTRDKLLMSGESQMPERADRLAAKHVFARRSSSNRSEG